MRDPLVQCVLPGIYAAATACVRRHAFVLRHDARCACRIHASRLLNVKRPPEPLAENDACLVVQASSRIVPITDTPWHTRADTTMWRNITNLGDVTVMAAAAVAIIAGLALERAWRMAVWWVVLFALGLLLVVATKVAFVGWGIGIRSLDFTGFSGHAMRAAAVIPVLAYLIVQNTSPLVRALGVAAGLSLSALIGISRLALHQHSVSEVIMGYLLGASVSLGFIWLLSRRKKVALGRPLIAFCVVTLLLLPRTESVSSQRMIVKLALYLSGHDRPFVREGWKLAPHDWAAREERADMRS